MLEHRLYTWPDFLEEEANLINQFFALGLPYLHLRKPKSSLKDCQRLLKKINSINHSKIILHQHWELADQFAIGGMHWTESRRAVETTNNFVQQVARQQEAGYQVGCAIHQPEQLSQLPPSLDYVTVSPIFESISKPNHKATHTWEDKGEHPFLLVALGGVSLAKLAAVQVRGFRSVALLGAVWLPRSQALKNYQQICLKIQQLLDLVP